MNRRMTAIGLAGTTVMAIGLSACGGTSANPTASTSSTDRPTSSAPTQSPTASPKATATAADVALCKKGAAFATGNGALLRKAARGNGSALTRVQLVSLRGEAANLVLLITDSVSASIKSDVQALGAAIETASSGSLSKAAAANARNALTSLANDCKALGAV